MNDKEKLEIWNRKLLELEERVKQLSYHRSILANVIKELNRRTNTRLNNQLYGIDLGEEKSHLGDWIEFYTQKIASYKNKIEAANNEISKQEFEAAKKLLKSEESAAEKEAEKEKKPKIRIAEKPGAIKNALKSVYNRAIKLYHNKIIIYSFIIIICLLIIAILFASKLGITGYTVLTQEKTFEDGLNLVINKSGNYTWIVNNPGSISSIKATGRLKNNGSAKVYIEKDGERYLILDINGSNSGAK